MMVSWNGIWGGWSEPQPKNGLITTLVMVWPSESTIGGVPPVAESSAAMSKEYSAWPKSKSPSKDLP